MNIMIMVTQLDRTNGGVCTHIVDLCKGFIADGHKVVVLAPNSHYTQKVKDTGAVYYETNFYFKKSIGGIKAITKSISKIIIDESIDIMHVHGQRIIPIAWLLRRKNKVPFLWTNHIDAIAEPIIVFRIMATLLKFPIISVSTDLKNFLVDEFHINKKRIRVICNGTDTAMYNPLTEEEKLSLYQKYNIQKNDYVISLLARIHPVKGQDVLLRVVNQVEQKKPDVHIKVLFAGNMYSAEEQWFKDRMAEAKAKKVDAEYIGFSTPRDVFGISNISVLPSQYEGFGLTCLESFMMETPVIRSNSPGWTDMKDICLVFPKNDEEAFAEKIIYAIDNKSKMIELGKKAKEKSEKCFTKEIMCNDTLEYYKKIISDFCK